MALSSWKPSYRAAGAVAMPSSMLTTMVGLAVRSTTRERDADDAGCIHRVDEKQPVGGSWH